MDVEIGQEQTVANLLRQIGHRIHVHHFTCREGLADGVGLKDPEDPVLNPVQTDHPERIGQGGVLQQLPQRQAQDQQEVRSLRP